MDEHRYSLGDIFFQAKEILSTYAPSSALSLALLCRALPLSPRPTTIMFVWVACLIVDNL
jgi:hypothetical protein